MSTVDLLAARMRQLEKRPEDIEQAAETLRHNRFKSKEQFEQRYKTRLVKGSYPPGTIILIRNKAIETSHSRKHQQRYCGPYKIVRQTRFGSYVISELDDSISRHGIAANRIIPYITRGDKELQKLALARFEEENEDLSTTSEASDEEI